MKRLLALCLLFAGGCCDHKYQETLVCIQNDVEESAPWLMWQTHNSDTNVWMDGVLTGGNALCVTPNTSVVFSVRR